MEMTMAEPRKNRKDVASCAVVANNNNNVEKICGIFVVADSF